MIRTLAAINAAARARKKQSAGTKAGAAEAHERRRPAANAQQAPASQSGEKADD